MNEPVLASICCVTYNHAPYIAQTLDSFLAQETDFRFEIVVHDDVSTDGTTEIVLDYAKRYPDIVIPLVPETNRKSRGISVFPITYRHSRGSYIAVCEGDDYWTDPLKLQKQIDLMEQDPECMLCFTSAIERREDRDDLFTPDVVKPLYTADDLFLENFLRTCTVVYRSLFREGFPPWFDNAPFGDWLLHLIHVLKGHACYIDEPTACYRVHQHGLWNAGDYVGNLEKTIDFCDFLMTHFPASQHKFIPKKAILRNRCDVVRYCLIWGNRPFYGRKHLLKALLGGAMPAQTFSQFLRLILWTLCPWAGLVLKQSKGGVQEPTRQ